MSNYSIAKSHSQWHVNENLNINIYDYIEKHQKANTLSEIEYMEIMKEETQEFVDIVKELLCINYSISAAREISIPVGTDETGNLYYVFLGRGTEQHVLIGGKIGSGKTNIIHIIIISIVCQYLPDEVTLYLLDFKYGVEFNQYAVNPVPHFHTIITECEREMSLAVLEEISEIVKVRSRLFKAHNVDNYSEYRTKSGQKLPRIVLIIDEFQVLLSGEDRISNESRRILTDLVRRGRSFAVHVILATQTLAGIGASISELLTQISTRIAFESFGNDSDKILGDSNSFAKNISGVGNAIMNTDCGNPKKNTFVSVGYIEPLERQDLLKQARNDLDEQGFTANPRVIDGSDLPLFSKELIRNASNQSSKSRFTSCLVGESIETLLQVSVELRNEFSSNVLIIGKESRTLHAGISTILRTLSIPNIKCEIYVFAPDEWFSVVNESNFRGAKVVSDPNEFYNVLDDFDARFKSGVKQSNTKAIIIILGLLKLRKLDCERSDKAIYRKFVSLLEAGPEFGLHFIVHSNNARELLRRFGRSVLSNFNYRLGCQMSAADSNVIFGNQIASNLSDRFIAYFDVDNDLALKVRPYLVE